jgi:predicted pyridoxine 5'-phosphate oxidase superfamily flavin-nucleotide-binding protein
VATRVAAGDPLATNLLARPEVGLLVLDPSTRQRARLNGRGRWDEQGLCLDLRQVYGNCPKYIQQRELVGDGTTPPAPPRVTGALGASQRAWIAAADTLFLASFHPEAGADSSHRGGRPGFVRVLGPDRLAFADYPGNAMFNSLGNLTAYPRAGLLFVDFETGTALQLTARARIGGDRTLELSVEEVRETRGATPLRFRLLEPSPSNPPLSHGAACGVQASESEEPS